MTTSARAVLSVLILCSTLTVPVRSAASAGSLPEPAALFKQVSCTSFLPGLLADRCGYVVMPENRAKPDGRTVQVAVAVFKSQYPNPHPDPVVVLSAPGSTVIANLGVGLGPSGMATYFGNRDVILVDLRGTGLSKPSLACPEIWAAGLGILDRHPSQKQKDALAVQATRQCRDRLVRAGVDLNAYTTLSDAADVAAIGPALGYPSVDLYGLSYGTRLALTVMRLSPEHLRSVILDSVLPPQAALFAEDLASEGHALSAMVATCNADAVCRKEYPRFAGEFSALVQQLDAHPAPIQITVPGVGTRNALLTGGSLVWSALAMLYDPSASESMFKMIATASHHDYALAAQSLGTTMEYDNPSYLSAGAYFSMLCSEDAPYTSPAQITAAGQALPAGLRPDAVAGELAVLQDCQAWHVQPVPAWQKTAVRSSVPTLILSGEYDPAWPPTLGQLAARTLVHSYVVTFPSTGSDQLFVSAGGNCPDYIALNFLRSPGKRLDTSCVALMESPTFQ